jgi:hypothetical protein
MPRTSWVLPQEICTVLKDAELFERKVIAVQKSAKDIVGATVGAEGLHERG